MFDFAYPYLLFLLLAIPLIWGIYELAQISKRRKLRRFGNPEVIAHLMPDASKYKPALKITLQLLALAAIVMVLARPRAGETENVKSVSNLEVMVAFDVSNSMLANSTDDPKSTSRLRRAKLLLEKLIDSFENDKVGLVIFAGDAKTQMPITSDFYSAKLFINDLQPSMISAQGTSIAQALQMAKAGFGKDENVHRAIILITDAEDHDGEAVETAAEIAKLGIQIDVVGVGSTKGSRIPLGGKSKGYMTDQEGNEVVTALNEEAAEQIAKAGKGVFVNGSSSDALDKLTDSLKQLGSSEFTNVKYKISAEQFPVFAWLAFILLIIDMLVLDRKNDWLKNVNFFSKPASQKTKKDEKK